MDKLNTIELFAGCGGFVDGFESTNKYNTLAAVEWNNNACETLSTRLKTKYLYNDVIERVLHFDIQRTEELINGWENDKVFGTHEGLDHLVNQNEVDLIIGGPPCQAYSLAGRIQDKDGMKKDYRNYLFESYLNVVGKYNPKIIVFENVEGMLSAAPDGENIVNKITRGFSQIGFDIIDDISGQALLDLSKFGVPQKRKRVILVGLNRDYFGNSNNNQKMLHSFYNNILSKYKEDNTPNVRETIGDLPKFFPSRKEFKENGRKYSHKPASTYLDSHTPRYHNIRDIQIFKTLSEDIVSGRNKFQNTDELKRLYTEKTGKVSNVRKYYVLRWDRESNTIPAHLKKDGLRHIHPDPQQARSITVREAARLQTFDDDYEFTGSMGQKYEMIGNAVPPKFAGKLAEAVYELIAEFC